MASNKRRRHTPDQIIRKLAEGNKLLAAGQGLDEVCRHPEIAESTWHRWLAQYGGMKANDAKRLQVPCYRGRGDLAWTPGTLAVSFDKNTLAGTLTETSPPESCPGANNTQNIVLTKR